jgi:hypothetical protein
MPAHQGQRTGQQAVNARNPLRAFVDDERGRCGCVLTPKYLHWPLPC